MRVTETAHWLEWQDWADSILQKPYEIKDGLLHIPNVPGIGLEWNEEAVKLISNHERRARNVYRELAAMICRCCRGRNDAAPERMTAFPPMARHVASEPRHFFAGLLCLIVKFDSC
jgi:hypothetical protein